MFGLGQIGSVRSVFPILLVGIVAYLYSQSGKTPEWECPIVNTSLGRLQGLTSFSRDGREYFDFRGIPYARPPVGELRFEPPQPAEPWSGVRDAQFFGSNCPQMSLFFGHFEAGSEDCLFINVYTPARNISDPKTRMPVMVWFYGGMFMEGKGAEYSASYFMDEDVVLVTLNYRVGALGFLNTNDALIRGNMGLKDQNLALKWVQENIKHFGGNENRVTIFGQSAGAASVHYHMLSPLSKGLFQRAISQSGVSLNPWALNPKPREQAFRLGNFLHCPNTSTSELVSCLKKTPVTSILETYTEVLSMLRDPISVYVPSIEAIKDSDAFIVEHPAEAIKKGSISRVPWMTGVTSHEGLIVSATIVRNKSLIEQDLDGWKALASHGLYYKREDPAMTEAIKQEYFGNAKSIADIGNEVFFQNLTTLFSDRHFFSGFQQAAISHASHADVYLYFLNYPMEFRLTEILLSIKGETHVLVEVVLDLVTRWFNKTFFGILPNFHGFCHAEEAMLFFDIVPPVTTISTKSKDYMMSKALVKLWANFATRDNLRDLDLLGTKWPPINVKDRSRGIEFLFIDNQVTVTEKPFGDRLEFWNSLDL